ncbi:hypothetical protein BGZ94_006854 [Podila epigama]|nr:hypothetical protein BGZ94_006854 [Podila epigama]
MIVRVPVKVKVKVMDKDEEVDKQALYSRMSMQEHNTSYTSSNDRDRDVDTATLIARHSGSESNDNSSLDGVREVEGENDDGDGIEEDVDDEEEEDDDDYIDCSEDADGEYDDHDGQEMYGQDEDEEAATRDAILMELQRDHLEFEENVRQLQEQLKQHSAFNTPSGDMMDDGTYSSGEDRSVDSVEVYGDPGNGYTIDSFLQNTGVCVRCPEPQSHYCLETYGVLWRPFIVRALATAAAAIALFHSELQASQSNTKQGTVPVKDYSQFLPRPQPSMSRESHRVLNGKSSRTKSGTGPSTLPSNPIQRHNIYPLPPNSPYKFGRQASNYLEPVGEFHEFQSAEGNSRQVLLHVWPPSNLDVTLLQKLEAACRDFQEHEVVRGHSGDGFLNGWRPSWKHPHQTGVLRFGHWRVRASSDHGTELYAPFQTPLTLAAAGGSILGSSVIIGVNNDGSRPSAETGAGSGSGHDMHDRTKAHAQAQARGRNGHHHANDHHGHAHVHDHYSSGQSCQHNHSSPSAPPPVPPPPPPQSQQEITQRVDQSRLLRLVRATQMVEKGIIARHLKYLFPTLYEKYHGLQFGTPRLYDAVATVALAMDVSPRLHHDKAHTKHGFCWIVACGDFVGGDLCIPELGKRVVMRPGTVVAIRSTVVAYYIERYARNTSMYTMYAYTADNCWPPSE